MRDLTEHLAKYSGPGPHGLVICGTQHKPIHRKTFYRNWNRATKAVGLPGFHFHDLRHTGNTLAATTGASTKELMSRMGHASARAGLHLPTRQQGAGCCPRRRSLRVDCGVHAQARWAELK